MRAETFEASGRALERALEVIPLGAQTFSRSHIQFPEGQAPLFLTHGDGGHVWDVDGNEYIDLVCGLMPVLLGYRDPHVDEAIRRQLDLGITFSLATELEAEVAEKLIEAVPCAEMVRFGKNGSDATTGAIRVARAATGRERIAICGYHGWHDWYVGSTTRNKGIPKETRGLTHSFLYNDISSLSSLFDNFPGEIAAVIMEPMNMLEPEKGFLQSVAKLTRSENAVLIFDEIITGFRFARGGAQEYFGVTPDLAAFGKAMGNGMPISAVVGKRDLMVEMEEIFFSSTFGGEALSLAAANAVLDKLKREPVIDKLWHLGSELVGNVRKKIDEIGLQDIICIRGKAPWTVIDIVDHPKARKEAIKTALLAELNSLGVLTVGVQSICLAHTPDDVSRVVQAYELALPKIRSGIDSGRLEQNLTCPVIEPVFKVR
ncbi:MAG: aminotransferase class III-fold pyridoxal phosphate-dependent enzyme [Alphaproteobacteria bacterium]|nr:aminotransferase class III-fold pyridoxal phosphate-dependent enzyme [Alphaproteobacteria bacterium]